MITLRGGIEVTFLRGLGQGYGEFRLPNGAVKRLRTDQLFWRSTDGAYTACWA